ncbi:MAG: hypothetical protein ONB46_18130 [candidate division KSB1 bacterium]|nr:hypothetical protein [candidate division KSB1 bacterium]
MKMTSTAHPFIVGLILSFILWTLSCTRQAPVAIDERGLKQAKVWHVFLKSGEEYVVKKPKIEDDDLVGKTWTDVTKTREKEIRISHNEIERISAEHLDSRRTMITISISVIILAPVIYFPSQSGDGFQ